jgi:hypothetical protein
MSFTVAASVDVEPYPRTEQWGRSPLALPLVQQLPRRKLLTDYYRYGGTSVGTYGGICTCPSGETYEVGDNSDYCGSLACDGGSAGPCSDGGISSANFHMRVTCGTLAPAAAPNITAASATMSSTYGAGYAAQFCIDDNLANFCHSESNVNDPWLQIDLGAIYSLNQVTIYNRQEHGDRLANHEIWVSDSPTTPEIKCYEGTAASTNGGRITSLCSAAGRYVRILLPGSDRILNLAEVKVQGFAITAATAVAASMSSTYTDGLVIGVPRYASMG